MKYPTWRKCTPSLWLSEETRAGQPDFRLTYVPIVHRPKDDAGNPTGPDHFWRLVVAHTGQHYRFADVRTAKEYVRLAFPAPVPISRERLCWPSGTNANPARGNSYD